MEIELAHFPPQEELHPIGHDIAGQPNLCNILSNVDNWYHFFKVFCIIFFAVATTLIWVIHDKPQHQPTLCDNKMHVSLNGSMQYRTISEAVDASKSNNTLRTCIIIKEGIYKESVMVPTEKINLAFIGDEVNKTIITSDNFFNFTSHGTLRDGFLAMDITIINKASPHEGKDAVAVENWGVNSIFYRCSFESHLRTLYAVGGEQFYKANEIQGSMYFIYGGARAFFQNCNIKVIPTGEEDTLVVSGNIGNSPTQKSAFVFQACKFTKSSNTTTTPVYLGAPLTAYSTEVVMESYLDSSVVGWQLNSSTIPCTNTAFLAEFNNKGEGARNRTSSVCSKMIEKSIATQFSMRNFFNNSLTWIPPQIPLDLDIH